MTFDDLKQLLNSPDPQVRIYGLMQLETHFDDFHDEEVQAGIELALADSDRNVVEQARRIKDVHGQHETSSRPNLGSLSLFDDPHLLEEARERFLSGFDLPQLEAAARQLLREVLERAHARARNAEDPHGASAVSSLGRLRLPDSIAVFQELARERRHLLEVAEALSWYTNDAAAELLLEMAAASQGAERVHALIHLGKLNRPEAFVLLTEAVSDGSSEVRKAAAEALGKSGAEGATGALIRLLSDSDEQVTLSALGSLARQRDETCIPAILETIQTTQSDRVKASAAIVLGRFVHRDSQDILLKLVRDADDRVRANALEALSGYSLSFDRAMKVYPPLLRDENHRVRGNAALALFRYHPQTALDAVEKMFHSSNPHMRAAAAYCSSQIQNRETAQWLATLVLTEQDTEVIRSALKALGHFNRREVLDIFLKVTKHPKHEVRTLAVKLLGSIGGPSHISFLTGMFRTENEVTTRSAIVSSIARIGGQEGLNFLPQFLADSNERVVANAIEGLNRSGNLEVISYLKPLLAHRNNRIRANTILALWNLGELKVVDDLAEMLAAREPIVVESGIYALGALGESLCMRELSRHPMLPIALRDHHDRVISRAESGRRPLRRRSREVPALDNSAEMPPSEPLSEASIAFIENLDQEDMTPLAGATTQRVNHEEEIEKVLDLVAREDEEAGQRLEELTAIYPKNPFVRFLRMRRSIQRDEITSEELADFQSSLNGQDDTFLPPLFLLARTLRRKGDVEDSVFPYLRILKGELTMLDKMVELGLEELGSGNAKLARSVMRTISVVLGLRPDLDALLGEFYLSEKLFERAYFHLYRAHLGDPGDASLALKLAFVCAKTKRVALGREICALVLNQHPEGSEDHDRARRFLERLPKG